MTANGTANLKFSSPKAAPSAIDRARATLALIRNPKNPGQKRKRVQILHRALRWCVQLGFLAGFPAAWNAGFNGAKYVFTQIGLDAPVELGGFLSLFCALTLFTCVFGRFFCGYACAFGTLGDLVFALAAPLRRALKLEGKGARRLPIGVQHALQLLKYFVLAGILVLCLLGIWPSISGMSPWVAFAGITARSFEGIAAGAFAALALVMVGMALIERFFCQFLCPFGAIFSLLPVLPVSLLNRDSARCAKRCNRCQDGCPVRIHPDRHSVRSGECIACGRCADGCPMANVTLLQLEGFKHTESAATDKSPAATEKRPSTATRKHTGAGSALRGNETISVLLKAAALALILHLLM